LRDGRIQEGHTPVGCIENPFTQYDLRQAEPVRQETMTASKTCVCDFNYRLRRRPLSRATVLGLLILLSGSALQLTRAAAQNAAPQQQPSPNAVEVPTTESPINVPEALRPKAPPPEPPAAPPTEKKPAKVAAEKKVPKGRTAKHSAEEPAPAETAAASPAAEQPATPAPSEQPAPAPPAPTEASAPGPSPAAEPADTGAWQSGLLVWRAQHEQDLKAPDSWLTLVGLEGLKTGVNSFGSAPDNQIRIHAQVPAHLGMLTVSGAALPGKAHAGKSKTPDTSQAGATIQLLAPRDGFPAGFAVNGAPPREGPLDVDGPKPTTFTWKWLTLVVINRGDRYMLRIKDADAPARTGFMGLKWFRPDPRYRVTARWIPYTPPHIEKIPTVIGTTLELPAPGIAEFTLDGKTLRLEPVIEADEQNQLFFILRDATSKTTTYGSGRFLHTALPDHGLAAPGELALDFNELYNPPCAYTPYATCPLPPDQNRLTVAIEAGEQRYAQ